MQSQDLIAKGLEYVLKYGSPSDIIGLILSGIGTAGTTIIGFGVKFIRDLARSVSDLNTTLAVLVEKTKNHDNVIVDHEARLRKIEDNE